MSIEKLSLDVEVRKLAWTVVTPLKSATKGAPLVRIPLPVLEQLLYLSRLSTCRDAIDCL